MLSGDGQYGLQCLRRPADQEPDVIEAHLEQPRAEPALRGPIPSGPGRADSVVQYSLNPPIRPVQQSTESVIWNRFLGGLAWHLRGGTEVGPVSVMPDELTRFREDATLPLLDVHSTEMHRAGGVEEPAVTAFQDG
jgi:hypothetical protein